MNILLDSPHRRLIYHAEYRLIINAVQAPRSGKDLDADCEEMLLAAHELKPRLWMNDNRLMTALSSEDALWLAEAFMPRFAQLPVERCAVVHAAQEQTNLMFSQMLDHATRHITWQERFFTSYDEAWSWLVKAANADRATWALNDE